MYFQSQDLVRDNDSAVQMIRIEIQAHILNSRPDTGFDCIRPAPFLSSLNPCSFLKRGQGGIKIALVTSTARPLLLSDSTSESCFRCNTYHSQYLG
jgi:hypothetical protein